MFFKQLLYVSVLLKCASFKCLAQKLEAGPPEQRCRVLPGDSNWPSSAEWAKFNSSIGGRLVGTVPLASSCHDNDVFMSYNQTKCSIIQSSWGSPEVHVVSSSSVMAPFYANDSCSPFNARTDRCVYGTFVRYAVNASSVDDYKKTIAFSQSKNLRLIIRNTGHDYYGKSTGAGALGLWTYYLKNISFFDYESPQYTGKAAKVGAGIGVGEAAQAAHQAGLVLVGGNCDTVGVTGGYTQGGGHGPLASKWGLGADQVLEWEVVTATGQHLIATPMNNHSDLYWALSGGGGGTFAAVYSMIVRAHPDHKTAAVGLTFARTGLSDTAFYGALQTFLLNMPAVVDTGTSIIWWLTKDYFAIEPAIAPGLSSQQLTALFQPTLQYLNYAKIPYNYSARDFGSFLESYVAMDPKSNVTADSLGGQLIPRSLVQSNQSASMLTDALRFITNQGAIVSGVSVNVSKSARDVDNAVNPAWRTAIFDCVLGIPWDYQNWTANVVARDAITNTLLPHLARITPGGGAYLNEGDPQQPNWQDVFFGSKYDRLAAIKAVYDPNALFYGRNAVGSENWTERSDGRLCRIK